MSKINIDNILANLLDCFVISFPFLYLVLFKSIIPSVLFKSFFIFMMFVVVIFMKKENFSKNILVSLLMIYMIIHIILVFLFLPNYNESRMFLWIYNITALFFLFFSINKKNLQGFIITFSIVSFVFLLLAYIEIFQGNYIFSDIFSNITSPFKYKISNQTGYYYSVLNFYNINDLAYFFVLGTPIVLMCLNKYKMIKIVYLISVFGVCFFNDAVLGQIFIIFYFLFLMIVKSIKKYNLTIENILKVLIVLIAIVSIIPFFVEILLVLIGQGSSGERLQIIGNSIEVSLQNMPYGVGIDGAKIFLGIPSHNIFLNILLELGIFVFIPFVIFYFKIVLSFIKIKNKEVKDYYLPAVILFFITNMMPSLAEYAEITWIFLGICLILPSIIDTEIINK